MKNPLTYLFLIMIVLGSGIPVAAQTPSEEIKTGRLLKRAVENGVDNYVYATFSFKLAVTGPRFKSFAVTFGHPLRQ